MNFGENLRKLRNYKKLSQESLAEKMKVSRQSVSKWETGDAYPEMNNILQLCKIFHCNINDLVNDNIVDTDLLNDEIKTNVIKFKKEQQLKVKTLSKTILIISKICKILTVIGISVVAISMIILGFIINKIDVVNDKIEYNVKNTVIDVIDDNNEVYIELLDMKLANTTDNNEIIKIKEILKSNSKLTIIGYLETALAFVTISLIFTYIMLKSLEALFTNIYEGDTPFTIENVGYIKRLSYLMIVLMILPNIVNIIFEKLLNMNLNFGFEAFSIVEILFLLCIAYIFQYGYEIQLDSKGKTYELKK